MASSLDTRVKKNNKFKLIFNVKNRAGTAINITDFTIKYEVRKTVTSDAVISKTTDDSNTDILLTDPVSGAFTIDVLAADTKDLPAGEYFHEVVLVDTFGNATTLTDLGVGFPRLYLVDQIAHQD